MERVEQFLEGKFCFLTRLNESVDGSGNFSKQKSIIGNRQSGVSPGLRAGKLGQNVGSSFKKGEKDKLNRDRKGQEQKGSARGSKNANSVFSSNQDADTVRNQNPTGSGQGTISEEPLSRREKTAVDTADLDQDPGMVNQLILAQQAADRRRQQ